MKTDKPGLNQVCTLSGLDFQEREMINFKEETPLLHMHDDILLHCLLVVFVFLFAIVWINLRHYKSRVHPSSLPPKAQESQLRLEIP